jgi:hypothetical protein
VRTDPEPNDNVAFDGAERAMPESDSGRVDWPGCVDAFEPETSVLWILPETPVGFTGPALNMIG